ncbi:MAG: aromatic ring-hydroxylating oxygenase subunit alpha [Ilumatobacter sp.]|uniref:aromatic ring-hydroxylating oxygenase subunit alpha n=1 Tax=Ilumatobacter sp. TaxID=1967498 RepID=UPI00391A06DD
MNLTTQRELIERISAQLDSGSDPMASSVTMQPSRHYVGADRMDRERTALFDSLPLVVGASDRLRRPGDFFTDDLTGYPLLVARGDDGVLRGFHNSCGHRGAAVEQKQAGCARRFTCPYHAWSYDTRGTLVSIPNDEGFNGVDRSKRGLVEFPVEERHGLVWARPTASADEAIDVAGFLGDLDAELATFEIDGYHHDRSDVLRDSFNWKQVVDGFLETYHLRFLHRDTIGPYITSNFALFDSYGPHGRMIALRDSFGTMRDLPADDRELLPHVAIIYQIFPNTVLVWQGDHFEVWSSHPDDGASTMAARASLLVPPNLTDPEHERRWDKNWQILMDTVLLEDFVVARSIHRNNVAGSRRDAVFGRQEAALQHFHSQLDARLTNPAITN